MELRELLDKLSIFNIPNNAIDNYFESHRHYHKIDHILDLCTKAESSSDVILDEKLLKAIVFHDVIYDPKSGTNEEDSVRYMNSLGIFDDDVERAILATKTHSDETSDHRLSKVLCELDLSILKSDMDTLKDFELKIFKEYQFAPFNVYRTVRLSILRKLGASNEHLSYLENFNPKIGFYPGTFNPFHVGHKDVLEKAEKIFDKVIVGYGKNITKSDATIEVPEYLKYHEIHEYSDMMTDHISSIPHDVTVIRGLRNHNDLAYESVQEAFLREMKEDIKIIYILADPKLAHVSSSAINMIKKYGGVDNYSVK